MRIRSRRWDRAPQPFTATQRSRHEGTGEAGLSFSVSVLIAGSIRLSRHKDPPPGPVNLGNRAEPAAGDLAERVLAPTGSQSLSPHPSKVTPQQCRSRGTRIEALS